jgi:hypothetical protein
MGFNRRKMEAEWNSEGDAAEATRRRPSLIAFTLTREPLSPKLILQCGLKAARQRFAVKRLAQIADGPTLQRLSAELVIVKMP